MFAIVKDNEIVRTAHTIRQLFPDTSFPASGASEEFKKEFGVMEVMVQERKNDRFYYVTPGHPNIQLIDGVPTQVYINTPKRLDDEFDEEGKLVGSGMKNQWIRELKNHARINLQPTDWHAIRKMERGIDIPEDVKEERAKIFDELERKEKAILESTTMEEFIAATTTVEQPIEVVGSADLSV